MRRMAIVSVLLLSGPAAFAAKPATRLAAIVLDRRAPAPVRFGAADLKQALTERGIEIAAPGQAAEASFRIGEPATDDEIRLLAESGRLQLPAKPESFCIKKLENRVIIAGSDAVGAMYGAFEAAERILNTPPGADLLKALKETTQSPYVRIRAVNPFLHVQALADKGSWFRSEKFWDSYLSTLARSRFNMLDLHATFDLLATNFPNVFPYLVQSQKFPAVGVPAQEKRRNVEMLKKIVRMAKGRGIMVGLMSYHASWKIPPNESPACEETEEALSEYHTEVVRKLVQHVPDLAFIGFRIGESGRKEGFYECYVQGVKEAGRPISIYTRSWLADPNRLRSLAARYAGKFFIEIKYNGEHLGLPYHVLGNRTAGLKSYSYQNYTNVPRDYGIIWQVRANGTHRVFKWSDPDFIRRCAWSFAYCGGAGFTIEPMTAYYPHTDALHWPGRGHRYYQWMHERDWFWHMLWGRLSYNPDTPDEVWKKAFQRRFGAKVGPLALEGFSESSRVAPLIYATHCLGPDHRNMAPELETGGSLKDFARVSPLDDSVIQSPAEYASNILAGRPSGKASPLEMAALLEKAGRRGRELLESALTLARDTTNPRAKTEIECLLEDARALEQLASYYANKLRAATEMELATMSGETGRLVAGRSYTREAHRHWEKLAEVTKRHYQPLLDTLRMHTPAFTWEEEGKLHLAEDYTALGRSAAETAAAMAPRGETPLLRHIPIGRLTPGQSLEVSAAAASTATDLEVSLFFRERGQQNFEQVRLESAGEPLVYRTQGLEAPSSGAIEYYLEARAAGAAVKLPQDAPQHLFRAPVSRDEQPPVVRFMRASFAPDASTATIVAAVKDQSPLSFVRLWYRPLPSDRKWESVEMKKQGDVYAAEAPLTSEGLLYRLEAADEAGNACEAPDFRKETPYRAIEPSQVAAVSSRAAVRSPAVPRRNPVASPFPVSALERSLI